MSDQPSARKEKWTVLKVLNWTTQYFQQKGIATPRLDAEVLLAHLLGTDRVGLYLNYDKPLKEEELKAFREMIQRRSGGEPIAYITGYKEFWGLRFRVTPACLVPRPSTELLVEEALKIARTIPSPKILEIGTGCGAVAIALAKELKEAQVVATDISPYALEVAAENAKEHGVEVVFLQADLFPEGEVYSLVVSNPPYVPTEKIFELEPEVRDYEPPEALDGGEDGLKYFRAIAKEAPEHLSEGGWLILEMGEGQHEQVLDILKREGFSSLELVPDLEGIKRVVKARWQG